MKFLVQSQFEMERHSGLTGILSKALTSITYMTLTIKSDDSGRASLARMTSRSLLFLN